MPSVRLSSAAEADVAGIAEYTEREHGSGQAAAYGAGLSETINALSMPPKSGQRAIRLNTRFRQTKYRYHFIFFRRDGANIPVVRVLHQAMDVVRHLP